MWGCRALAALLLVASSAGAQENADAEEELAKGEEYLLHFDYARAIRHFNAARTLAPDKPGPYVRLGMAHAAAGQCAEAIPFLEEYLRRKPTDPRPQAVATLEQCKAELAPKVGVLVVESVPPGAEVRIDESEQPPLGVTPYRNEQVAAGNHLVFVRKPGFLDASRVVTVLRGETATAKLELQPGPAPASEAKSSPRRAPAEPASVASARPARSRKWIWGVVGGSAALVAIAIVAGVLAATGSSTKPLAVVDFR